MRLHFSPTNAFWMLLIALSSPGNLFAAQDETTNELGKSLENAGADIMSNIQRAFSGGEGADAAQDALLKDLFVPAAMALILLIVGYLFASFMGRVVGNIASKRIDKTIGKFAGRMVQNAIIVLVLIGALGYFGVDVTSFAAIIAAAGFAVGMALQGTLGNFAAGIMLLIFRPFQVDDYIEVSGTAGTVEEIDLFTTKVNTTDNRHIIIPNGSIFGETLTNFSRNPLRRADVSVGAAYDADIQMTRTILERAVANILSLIHI